jgi:asparagine synthase (glutamine-hydrolysing)
VLRAAAAISGGERGRLLRYASAGGMAGLVRAQRSSATGYWNGADLSSIWRGGEVQPIERVIDSWYEPGRSDEPLDILQNAWCQDWLVEDLLMKADKMTMANSIELRVPFLTHSFVEWAQRLPIVHRVGNAEVGYTTKGILRRFAQARMPREIIDRPKQGFPVPVYQWLKGELGGWAAARLADPRSPLGEWVNVDAVEPTLAAARAGVEEAAHRIWALLVLDYWLRRWL